MINFEEWEGFEGRIWKEEVNVRDFIQKNYTPYDGDESFLADPTEATNKPVSYTHLYQIGPLLPERKAVRGDKALRSFLLMNNARLISCLLYTSRCV